MWKIYVYHDHLAFIFYFYLFIFLFWHVYSTNLAQKILTPILFYLKMQELQGS